MNSLRWLKTHVHCSNTCEKIKCPHLITNKNVSKTTIIALKCCIQLKFMALHNLRISTQFQRNVFIGISVCLIYLASSRKSIKQHIPKDWVNRTCVMHPFHNIKTLVKPLSILWARGVILGGCPSVYSCMFMSILIVLYFI